MPGQDVSHGTAGKTGHSVFADTAHFFHKQRAAIAKLRHDNQMLKEELLLENKFSVQPTSANASALIANLQDQSDVYTRKIEMERGRCAELDEKAASLREKIAALRKQMGGINAAKEGDIVMQKQMRILENRLEKAYHKYNESKNHNKTLRDQIDNLRRERLVFDDIFKKLEKGLQVQKKEMAAIIQISNAAYEGREKAINEMAVCKAASDKEQAMYEAEWKQLTALIDHDRRQREAVRDKEINERERRTAAILKQETTIKKKVIKNTWNIAKDKTNQNISLDKVQEYGEAFKQIQDATGIKEIDKLVERFMEAEDANFTLFNYVNEVNGEVEKLEDQIAQIKAEIERYQGQDVTHESQRKQILQDLQDRLAKTEEKAAQYEHKHESAQRRVATLKGGIADIFAKVGCDTPAVRDMLGDGGVTESNMMQYLGIIEQRTNELLQDYVACVAQNAHDEQRAAEKVRKLMSTIGAPALQPALSGSLVIEPPSTIAGEDVSDDEDGGEAEGARPLDRQALEQKVQRSLAKRGDTSFKARSPPKSPGKGGNSMARNG
ncbi:hypothetical protein WJX72_000889 [[Myrmecia] bisecta]|uniref:ODAD1 central coiled coil region domain-containing protein n=1 Tax=[Myrmecia] bisecta TaxID=41462 RepID=A0AAW1Q6Z1_9CHLO